MSRRTASKNFLTIGPVAIWKKIMAGIVISFSKRTKTSVAVVFRRHPRVETLSKTSWQKSKIINASIVGAL